jgi:hypothetical protein
MSPENLDAGVILGWIKVALKREDVAAKLDFTSEFWRLVNSSKVKLEEVGWITVASGNKAEAAKNNFLLDFWRQLKAINLGAQDLEDDGIAYHVEAIATGIVPETLQRKQLLWQKRERTLSQNLEKDRSKMKAQSKRSSGTPIDLYLKDVHQMENNFSLQHSLLLAELHDPKHHYGTPQRRLKLLWYVLTYNFDREVLERPEKQYQPGPVGYEATQQQAGSATDTGDTLDPTEHLFRTSPAVVGSPLMLEPPQTPEHPDYNRSQLHGKLPNGDVRGRKRSFGEAADTCNKKRPRLHQELILSHGLNMITVPSSEREYDSRDCSVYAGIGHAKKSEDRCLRLQWFGYSAVSLTDGTIYDSFTDKLWVYTHPDRSFVKNLSSKKLSDSIQRSSLWKEEMEQEQRTTACMVILTPKGEIMKHFGTHVYVEVTIPSIDAPTIEGYVAPPMKDHTFRPTIS